MSTEQKPKCDCPTCQFERIIRANNLDPMEAIVAMAQAVNRVSGGEVVTGIGVVGEGIEGKEVLH